LTRIFVESCVDFEVAHLSVLMVWRLPYPEIPTLRVSRTALLKVKVQIHMIASNHVRTSTGQEMRDVTLLTKACIAVVQEY